MRKPKFSKYVQRFRKQRFKVSARASGMQKLKKRNFLKGVKKKSS